MQFTGTSTIDCQLHARHCVKHFVEIISFTHYLPKCPKAGPIWPRFMDFSRSRDVGAYSGSLTPRPTCTPPSSLTAPGTPIQTAPCPPFLFYAISSSWNTLPYLPSLSWLGSPICNSQLKIGPGPQHPPPDPTLGLGVPFTHLRDGPSIALRTHYWICLGVCLPDQGL